MNKLPIASHFGRMRSLLLLAGLLTVILAVPLMAKTGSSGVIARLFYTGLFCTGGYLLGGSKQWITWYLSLAIPTMILGVITSAYPETRTLDIVRDVMTLVLEGMLITVVIRYSLLNSEATELDRILAGICGYLILALLWYDLYSLVDHFSEEPAFVHSGGAEVTHDSGLLVYFSLVTLTTLGYGDIAPANHLAKTLSALEAVAGTLYLAVLIASLLSGLRRERKS